MGKAPTSKKKGINVLKAINFIFYDVKYEKQHTLVFGRKMIAKKFVDTKTYNELKVINLLKEIGFLMF